jgi:proprotein convertase subtilisin/kexin type 2
LNVEEAWAMGYTGKNVTTAIMDDGVDYTHPDLMNNFVIYLMIIIFIIIC